MRRIGRDKALLGWNKEKPKFIIRKSPFSSWKRSENTKKVAGRTTIQYCGGLLVDDFVDEHVKIFVRIQSYAEERVEL